MEKRENSQLENEKRKGNGNDNLTGWVALVIALIGIIVLFRVRVVLGFPIYIVAFLISLYELNKNVAYEDTFNIFKFIGRIGKGNFFKEGIFTIIVAAIPIIIIIATYRWIYVDTFRDVEMFM